MTNEQKAISKYNRDKAAEYFNLQSGEVLHHINPEWRHSDVERYIQWNVEDLVVMTKSEHSKLHADLEWENEEFRKKQSEAHLGNQQTEEARKKISEANKGKVISAEQRAAVSEAMKKVDRKGEKNGRFGKKCSEETRAKMSAARKKYWQSQKLQERL